jgi:hypothetical protein
MQEVQDPQDHRDLLEVVVEQDLRDPRDQQDLRVHSQVEQQGIFL